MTMREQLIQTCDTYCEAAGIGRKRLSTLILNGGSKLDHVANGGDLYTGTAERAMQWLSDHWPDGAVWPVDVPRPSHCDHSSSPVQTDTASVERHGNNLSEGFRGREAAE